MNPMGLNSFFMGDARISTSQATASPAAKDLEGTTLRSLGLDNLTFVTCRGAGPCDEFITNGKWEGEFTQMILGKGKLKADDATVTWDMPVANFRDIPVPQQASASLGEGKQVRIYAGFPTREGKVRTVRFKGRTPEPIDEIAAGPLLVVAFCGFKDACASAVIDKFQIIITRGGRMLCELINRVDPEPDAWTKENKCLTPRIVGNGGLIQGSIDFPGGRGIFAGSTVKDSAGKECLLKVDDQAKINFAHRIFLIGDGVVVGAFEWRFEMTYTLTKNPGEEEVTSSSLSAFQLLLPEDLATRKRFAAEEEFYKKLVQEFDKQR